MKNTDQKVDQEKYAQGYERIFSPICIDCGSEQATWQPCPYESDLNGDYTEYPLCDSCANNRGMEL